MTQDALEEAANSRRPKLSPVAGAVLCARDHPYQPHQSLRSPWGSSLFTVSMARGKSNTGDTCHFTFVPESG